MTTFFALSPRKKTAHLTAEAARDQLISDAVDLSKKKQKDPAEQGLFEMAANAIRKSEGPTMHWSWYDTWGNKVSFQIVEQEQFAL